MSILQDRPWKLKYTPDHGDLVKLLYLSTPVKNRRYLPQFGLTGWWLVQVVHRRVPPP
jgi:hypothetical protein